MTTTLPAFSQIRVDQIEPTIRQLLTEHRVQLTALLQQPEPTFSSLVLPLEEMHHRLARTWSPIGHMNGVVNSDELRAAYNACLPLLVGWNTELAQNEQLFRAYSRILEREGAQLSSAQRKLIENAAACAVEAFNKGNEVEAYEFVSDIRETEEKLFLWNYLQPHSALRSAIKRMAQADKTPIPA